MKKKMKKALRDHFGWWACRHSFMFYKNDIVVCKKHEVVGAGYVECWCRDCDDFKYNHNDMRDELPGYGVCSACADELGDDYICIGCGIDYSDQFTKKGKDK